MKNNPFLRSINRRRLLGLLGMSVAVAPALGYASKAFDVESVAKKLEATPSLKKVVVSF